MPMKVEAAIVTRKRPEAAFNTDSVNVNGKVFPREVIKNGYKGSGIISGSAYFALTSSAVDGFADAAVAAFNERAEVFPVVKDARTVFSGFYEDCRSALLNMGRDEKELTCACFYASGRKVALAGNGDVRLYLCRLNNCTPVSTEKVVDTVAEYSGSIFSDVTVGDIFILLSPGSAEVISEKEIEDICRISDGSVKRVINYITKVAFAKDGEKAVSAIAVKILDTAAEDSTVPAGFVPDFSDIEKKNEASQAESSENKDSEKPAEETNETVVNADVSEKTEAEDITVSAEEASAENEGEADVQECDNKAEETEAAAEDSLAVSIAEAIAEAAVADAVPEIEEENSVTEPTEEEIKEKADKRTRIVLFSILGVLVAISLVLIAVIISKSGLISGGNEETTAEETTTVEETTEEATSEEETTEEETTEEETTEEEAATNEEETTRRAQQTVTPVTPAVTTTAAPVETTSEKPEETTSRQTEETTAAPVEETSAEAETEEEQETESTSAEELSSETEETPSEEEPQQSESSSAEETVG